MTKLSKAVLGFLSDFSTYSGLKLNTTKTEVVWLGRNVNKKDKPLDCTGTMTILSVSEFGAIPILKA